MKKKLVAMTLAICITCSLIGCQKETSVVSTQVTTEASSVAEIESEEETVVQTAEEVQIEDEDSEGEALVERINILSNGDFSKNTDGWGTYISEGGEAELSVKDEAGAVDIKKLGTVQYSNQLYYDGFSLNQGGVYELSFEAASTVERQIEARVQYNGGDYHAYVEDKAVKLTSEMQKFTYTFNMEEATDVAPRLCFNMGTAQGLEEQEHTVTIDNVSLVLVDAGNVKTTEDKEEAVNVNTNQIGYRTEAVKTAIVRNHKTGDTFTVVDEKSDVVYEGKLTDEITSDMAGETVCTADFSDLNKEGKYRVVCGDDSSFEFEINDNVYDELLNDVVRFMYMQRCGVEITNELGGKFAHPVCHNTEALIYGTNEKKDVSGGWHDAGDYGRYVVTGAQTAMDLMLCYESNPDYWNKASLNIPESESELPDILEEVKFEIDWLLKMQDEKTGGVYHKVTCRTFPGFVMPEAETAELVISPVSGTATADFAAVMAKASTVYKNMDVDFSKNCLDAAIKAWEYIKDKDFGEGFINPADITTGQYDDVCDTDERYWAAVELYKVTGDQQYKEYFENVLKDKVPMGYGWIEMGSYGNLAYLSMDSSKQDKAIVDKIKSAIIAEADKFVENAKVDGYNCTLGIDGYCWGSNLGACNNARVLLQANEFTGRDEYKIAAQKQLDYLLGENSLSTCFVSGYGTISPNNVHHRPSVVQKETVKGMIVGGPNVRLEDPYAATALKGQPAAKCYADHDQSYSTNEVTIYWNSPLASLLTEILK